MENQFILPQPIKVGVYGVWVDKGDGLKNKFYLPGLLRRYCGCSTNAEIGLLTTFQAIVISYKIQNSWQPSSSFSDNMKLDGSPRSNWPISLELNYYICLGCCFNRKQRMCWERTGRVKLKTGECFSPPKNRGHLFTLYFLSGRTEGGVCVIMIEMVIICFNNSRQIG